MMGKRRARSSRKFANQPLPPCEGSQLHAFKHPNAPIEWLERLDEERSRESKNESFVFKARIESRIYAVKIVQTPSHVLLS